MKYIFESYEDYDKLWQSVHDSIIYWRKVRQNCQGKINLQVDGGATHYSEKYAIDMIIQNALILKDIEDSPHPEWNDKTNTYDIVNGVDYNSIIITKALKLVGQGNESE